MLLLQSFLLLHKLPYAHRNILKQILIYDTRIYRFAPERLTPTAIIIHCIRSALPRLSKQHLVATSSARAATHPGTLSPPLLPRPFQRLLLLERMLGLLALRNPFFHLVPVHVPDAVHTPAHAAVVRLVWAHRHPHACHEATLALDIELPCSKVRRPRGEQDRRPGVLG